eukprot:scaffold52902_cov71-Phaeocystis_antarctica.AAC.2
MCFTSACCPPPSRYFCSPNNGLTCLNWFSSGWSLCPYTSSVMPRFTASSTLSTHGSNHSDAGLLLSPVQTHAKFSRPPPTIPFHAFCPSEAGKDTMQTWPAPATSWPLVGSNALRRRVIVRTYLNGSVGAR